jgi:hypothetical protein
VDDVVGLTVVDVEAGLTVVDVGAGLTVVDVEVGLTVVDVEAGLTVVDVEAGLTVVDVEVDGVDADLPPEQAAVRTASPSRAIPIETMCLAFIEPPRLQTGNPFPDGACSGAPCLRFGSCRSSCVFGASAVKAECHKGARPMRVVHAGWLIW